MTIRHQDSTHVVQPDSIPSSMPTGLPQTRLTDNTFTLQAIMELQKATGQLTANVQALQKTIEDQGCATRREIDRVVTDMKAGFSSADTETKDLKSKVSGVTHKIYAAGVVLSIFLVVSGWLVNCMWQMIRGVAMPALQEALNDTPGGMRPSRTSTPASLAPSD